MTRLGTATALAGAVLAALVGCNAILGNDPGVLVVSDEAGTEPEPDTGVPPAPIPEPTPGEPPPPPLDSGTVVVLDAGAPVDSGGTTTCAPGQVTCAGACVDAADPRFGCGDGSCAPCVVAHGTPTCTAGRCVVGACDVGFADCNATTADGCETDLSRAVSCGACGAACPAMTPVCSPKGPTFQCTSGCPANAPARCGAECVDLLTSVAHCGACATACPAVDNATTSCTLGACSFTCRPGFRACGGRCSMLEDPAACGPACLVCPAVPNGRATCNGQACGGVCEPGFADCDGAPANGCEAALLTSPLHCGVCGRACASGVCVAGVCAPVADAGGG